MIIKSVAIIYWLYDENDDVLLLVITGGIRRADHRIPGQSITIL